MDFTSQHGHTGRSSSPSGLGGRSASQGGSQVLGMTGGTSMRAQVRDRGVWRARRARARGY
jgi:hypothetical protein